MKLNHNPRAAYLIKDVADCYTLVHCASRTTTRFKELEFAMQVLSDVEGIGSWDEGAEEYLEPLALFCSFVPNQQEYDDITGVWCSEDGRDEWSCEWMGLVSRILCPKAIIPPRPIGPELHKLPSAARAERHNILRLLDSINRRFCGQPQLTGIMEVKQHAIH